MPPSVNAPPIDSLVTERPTGGEQQGDVVAEIYRDHRGWLLNWLHNRLSCRHTAADLSHDTFIRLILGDTHPGNLREPRAYLMVIASRLLINRHHRKQVEEEALRQVAVLLEKVDSRDPGRIADTRQLLACVLKLLSEELPEKPRQAFLMARLEGMSYQQIANKLEVSPSSVKQYLAKALAHCHARLYDSLIDE